MPFRVSVSPDASKEAVEDLKRQAEKQGGFRDLCIVSGPGFAGIDGLTSYDRPRLERFLADYVETRRSRFNRTRISGLRQLSGTRRGKSRTCRRFGFEILLRPVGRLYQPPRPEPHGGPQGLPRRTKRSAAPKDLPRLLAGTLGLERLQARGPGPHSQRPQYYASRGNPGNGEEFRAPRSVRTF